MKTLTVLIPFFNEERTISKLVQELNELPAGMIENCIFINDVSTKVKRLGKYKYIFKNKNITKMNLFLNKICQIKPINIYTKRGIRKGRQIIFKRKGKIFLWII